jgi:hypothetical protein
MTCSCCLYQPGIASLVGSSHASPWFASFWNQWLPHQPVSLALACIETVLGEQSWSRYFPLALRPQQRQLVCFCLHEWSPGLSMSSTCLLPGHSYFSDGLHVALRTLDGRLNANVPAEEISFCVYRSSHSTSCILHFEGAWVKQHWPLVFVTLVQCLDFWHEACQAWPSRLLDVVGHQCYTSACMCVAATWSHS